MKLVQIDQLKKNYWPHETRQLASWNYLTSLGSYLYVIIFNFCFSHRNNLTTVVYTVSMINS